MKKLTENELIFISLLILSLGTCIENNTKAFIFVSMLHFLMLLMSEYREHKIVKKMLKAF